MPPTPVSLGVRSNPGSHNAESAARLINGYAEDAGEEGKIRFPIRVSDGMELFVSLVGQGGVRAALALDATDAYVVAGRIVYHVTSAAIVTALGGFDTSGPCFMARNRADPTQIAIVSDGLFYVIEDNVLSQINDADLPAPNSVTAIDGYFVFTIEDGRFFISGIDATTIDALDFASAEANPDGLLVGATRGRELVLFGPRSIEFWTNTGNADFPFERVQSVNIGCHAAGSVCETTFIRGESTIDTICWAGTDAQGAYAGVMMLNGYSGSKISTHAVDRSIRDEPDTDDIRSFTWSAGGHTFYCITGTTFSWVYDMGTGFWHERKSYGLEHWRAVLCFTFGTTNILGDYASGVLYRMAHDIYEENGEPLIMTVQPPAIHAWPSPMRFDALYIDAIPGVGINATADADAEPMMMLDHSNDNGHTWLAERHIPLGALGKRRTRLKAFRFGQSGEDGKVFRMRVSAKVMKGITGLAVDARTVKG